MKTRIAWIDMIKGMACLMIFTHHFLLAFLPATYYGNQAYQHCSWDAFLSNSPLSFVINGDFMVFIFVLMSNFLAATLSLNHKCDKDYIATAMIKRYLRFSITIFLLGIVTYNFQRLHIFSIERASEISKSTWLNGLYGQIITIKDLFMIPFFRVLFQCDGTISTALWMICYVFMGSYISWMLAMIAYKNRRTGIIACLVLIIAFGIRKEYFLCMAPIGGVLAVLYNIETNPLKHHKIDIFIALIAILAGCYFGGYPSCGLVEPGGWYSWMKNDIRFNHMIGAIGFIFPIAYIVKKNGNVRVSGRMRRVFEKLGHVSYEVYLLHIPLIATLSSFLLIAFNRICEDYILAVLLDYIISICMLILLAVMANRWISKVVDKRIEILLLG